MAWFSTVILGMILVYRELMDFRRSKRLETERSDWYNKMMSQNEIYFSRCLAAIKDEPALIQSHSAPGHMIGNNTLRRSDTLEAQIADAFGEDDGA